MERTHRRLVLRAGLGALTALVMLLAGMGTGVASGAVEPERLAAMAQAAPLDEGWASSAGRRAALMACLARAPRRPCCNFKRLRVLPSTVRQDRRSGMRSPGRRSNRCVAAPAMPRQTARRGFAPSSNACSAADCSLARLTGYTGRGRRPRWPVFNTRPS